MTTKEIYSYKEVRNRIVSGLDKLAAPIIQTLTPQGRDCLIQDDLGRVFLTRDGFTIARHITLEDPIENTIADIIKQASFETNRLAGDGTTTSILLSQALIKDGFRLIDEGISPQDLKKELGKASEILIKELDKLVQKVESEEQLRYIAHVSASNDGEIAENILKTIRVSGEDGLVFLEATQNSQAVEIVGERGFYFQQGLFNPMLGTQRGRGIAAYENIPVFITDKRLYYEEECREILKTVTRLGYNNVAIVARDFIGQSANFFIANHLDPKVNLNILLVRDSTAKDNQSDTLDDLAHYLGGEIISDKRGSFIGKLKETDFTIAEKAFADGEKTILVSAKKKNPALDIRIKALKDEMKKEEDNSKKKEYERRIACLTNGITTIKVGGKTPAEAREKLFRYEDSLHATRNAMKHGFVVGGGNTLKRLWEYTDLDIPERVRGIIENFCLAPLRQISTICNLHYPTLLEKVFGNMGYNVNTEQYEDLLESGIIEPYLVVKHSIQNSISVAQIILGADYIIVNSKEKEKDEIGSRISKN